MSISRSDAGESNKHLFYGVEEVVYVEGGGSYNINQILEGKGDYDTNDVCFWQVIFNHFDGQRSVRIRSVGSKLTLLKLASKVMEGKISNVIICLDRDYDHFFDRKVDNNSIIYTYGYSWENDIFYLPILNKIYFCWVPNCEETQEACKNFPKILSDIEKKLPRYVRADAALVINGDSLFPRDSVSAVICRSGSIGPTVNWARLRTLLRQKRASRSQRIRIGKRIKVDARADMVGRLLSRLCYYVVIHALQVARAKNNQISFDIFVRTAISQFISIIDAVDLTNVAAHYRDRIAKLPRLA